MPELFLGPDLNLAKRLSMSNILTVVRSWAPRVLRTLIETSLWFQAVVRRYYAFKRHQRTTMWKPSQRCTCVAISVW